MKKNISLGLQILIGLILGIILGTIFYQNQQFINFANSLGAIFLNLISMIVLPIVGSCLIVGIAELGDMKKLGRIGAKTLIYFEIMSTLAFILGLFVANLAKLGHLINLTHLSKVDISKYLQTAQTTDASLGHIILSIVPTNFFGALATGKILPVIFFCTLFGLGLAQLGEKGKIIINFLQAISNVMFIITAWVMKVAPFGVAGLIGATVAQLGLQSLKPLILFIGVAYLTMGFFVLVILGITSRLFGLKITEQLKIAKDEIILSFTTASSEVTLPKLMEKTQKLGVKQSISSFVIPTGYTFNLDGSAIYQALAAIFLAQAYHIHLSLGQQLTLLLVLMISSKGMAGVPGSSFVVLLTAVATIGVPPSGLALIAGIDRLVDMGRSAVNVIGNMTAVLVIAQSEKAFDKTKHQQYLQEITK